MSINIQNWSLKRLKYIAICNAASLPEDHDPDATFKYIDIGCVTQGHVDLPEDETIFSVSPSRARRLAEPHDTVISTIRTYLRAVAEVPTSDTDLVFSTGFAVLHPKPIGNPRFLAYHCQSDKSVDRVVANSVGVSYPAITASQLMSSDLLLPPPAEQKQIADFLDRETKQIDNLIAEQEGLVENLTERRAAAIDQTVLGGLDGCVRQHRRSHLMTGHCGRDLTLRSSQSC